MNQPLRVVFAGTPEFAVPCLKACVQPGVEVVAVYTQPDRPAGRGRKLSPSPVKQAALDAGYRVDLPSNLENLIERAKASDDRVCRRVLEDAARNIGLALARVCNIINPELIVIGGELGRAGDLVTGPAASTLRQNALEGMLTHREPTEMKPSELGMLAGPRGALAFALLVDRQPG